MDDIAGFSVDSSIDMVPLPPYDEGFRSSLSMSTPPGFSVFAKELLYYKTIRIAEAKLKVPRVMVQVVNMSGLEMFGKPLSPTTTVKELKRQLERRRDVPLHEMHLMLEEKRLQDDEPLLPKDWDGAEPLSLTMVRSGASSISLRCSSRREEDEAAFAGFVDQASQNAHAFAERVRPQGADRICEAIDKGKRRELLKWMVQVCGRLQLDPALFFRVCLTLDRYYDSRAEEVEDSKARLLLSAIISLELKLSPELSRYETKQVVERIAGDLPLCSVSEAEMEVLAQLNAEVGVSSVYDFLCELCKGLASDCEEMTTVSDIALLFLYMASLEPEFLYKRSQVLLAGAAIMAALRVAEVEGLLGSETCAQLRETLVKDLRVYDQQNFEDADIEVSKCERELLKLWYNCFKMPQLDGPYTAIQEELRPRLPEGVYTSGKHVAASAFRAFHADKGASTPTSADEGNKREGEKKSEKKSEKVLSIPTATVKVEEMQRDEDGCSSKSTSCSEESEDDEPKSFDAAE